MKSRTQARRAKPTIEKETASCKNGRKSAKQSAKNMIRALRRKMKPFACSLGLAQKLRVIKKEETTPALFLKVG